MKRIRMTDKNGRRYIQRSDGSQVYEDKNPEKYAKEGLWADEDINKATYGDGCNEREFWNDDEE